MNQKLLHGISSVSSDNGKRAKKKITEIQRNYVSAGFRIFIGDELFKLYCKTNNYFFPQTADSVIRLKGADTRAFIRSKRSGISCMAGIVRENGRI